MRFKTPEHGTVIAYVALFVALSGTAVAATGAVGSNSASKARTAALPARVVTVSATSNPTANGTALRRALHGLLIAPHNQKQRELLVGPGTYDVGRHSIGVPFHVTVVGSGVQATKIRTESHDGLDVDGDVSVRDLTVVVNAATGDARAADIGDDSATSVDLRDVNLVAHAPKGQAYGIWAEGAVTAEDVTVRTTGDSLSVGIDAPGSPSEIVFRNGSIVTDGGVSAAGACDGCSVLIVSSQLNPTTTVPTATCIGDYTPQNSVDAYYATIPDGPCPS